MIMMPMTDESAIYRRIFLKKDFLYGFNPRGTAFTSVNQESTLSGPYNICIGALKSEFKVLVLLRAGEYLVE
jgi:hypothetical protein